MATKLGAMKLVVLLFKLHAEMEYADITDYKDAAANTWSSAAYLCGSFALDPGTMPNGCYAPRSFMAWLSDPVSRQKLFREAADVAFAEYGDRIPAVCIAAKQQLKELRAMAYVQDGGRELLWGE